jgi:predicted dehydrogenase
MSGQHATTSSRLGPALSVEDTAVLALRSTNGVLGVIEASWRTRPGEAVVRMSGTDGTLHLDYATMTLTTARPMARHRNRSRCPRVTGSPGRRHIFWPTWPAKSSRG